MYRKIALSTLVSLFLLLLAVIAFAQTENPRPVSEDGFWSDETGTIHFLGTDTYLWTYNRNADCSELYRSAILKWDLNDITSSETVGEVKIVLHNITFVDGIEDGDTVFGLFEAPDNWSESDSVLAFNPPNPATTTPLATVTLPATLQSGDNVTFTATGTGDPLVQYIQQQIQTDKVVSLWAQFAANCGDNTSNPNGSRLHWDAREAGTTYLSLWDTNAVNLTEMASQDQEINWMLITGLILLTAIVVAGISYGARRLNL